MYGALKKINEKVGYELFTYVDTNLLHRAGIDSEKRMKELLLNERGYAFYPDELRKFKVFVLHEICGGHFRKYYIGQQKSVFIKQLKAQKERQSRIDASNKGASLNVPRASTQFSLDIAEQMFEELGGSHLAKSGSLNSVHSVKL